MYVFVCDIDGTVADTKPRIDAICQKYNTGEATWTSEQIDEFVNPELIKVDVVIAKAKIILDLAKRCGAKLVFLTGRSDRARKATRLWLKDKLGVPDNVPLIMRAEDDYDNTTAECKENNFLKFVFEVYKEAKFVFFEDELDLLQRYSKYGLALKAPQCWDVIQFMQLEEKDDN